jgi:hypothetical protein
MERLEFRYGEGYLLEFAAKSRRKAAVLMGCVLVSVRYRGQLFRDRQLQDHINFKTYFQGVIPYSVVAIFDVTLQNVFSKI